MLPASVRQECLESDTDEFYYIMHFLQRFPLLRTFFTVVSRTFQGYQPFYLGRSTFVCGTFAFKKETNILIFLFCSRLFKSDISKY